MHVRKKIKLKVVGVLEVSTWSGARISVLVGTWGAALKIEMDWWWFGCFSRYYNVTHISTACTAFTDMVYPKELEREITTTEMAKAILRLKTLASFLHRT